MIRAGESAATPTRERLPTATESPGTRCAPVSVRVTGRSLLKRFGVTANTSTAADGVGGTVGVGDGVAEGVPVGVGTNAVAGPVVAVGVTEPTSPAGVVIRVGTGSAALDGVTEGVGVIDVVGILDGVGVGVVSPWRVAVADTSGPAVRVTRGDDATVAVRVATVLTEVTAVGVSVAVGTTDGGVAGNVAVTLTGAITGGLARTVEAGLAGAVALPDAMALVPDHWTAPATTSPTTSRQLLTRPPPLRLSAARPPLLPL